MENDQGRARVYHRSGCGRIGRRYTHSYHGLDQPPPAVVEAIAALFPQIGGLSSKPDRERGQGGIQPYVGELESCQDALFRVIFLF